MNTPDASTAAPFAAEQAKLGSFLRRAMSTANGLPPRLVEQMKHTPFAVVAGAFVVGGGLGIIFSSRILRGVVTATATAAAIELMRDVIRQNTLSIPAT